MDGGNILSPSMPINKAGEYKAGSSFCASLCFSSECFRLTLLDVCITSLLIASLIAVRVITSHHVFEMHALSVKLRSYGICTDVCSVKKKKQVAREERGADDRGHTLK